MLDNEKRIPVYFYRSPGGSMLGDVNISAILDSFSVSYDKRVRPNYGGECKYDVSCIIGR